MSTVKVTELPEGKPATSADVNETLESFNAATAPGALSSSNFRPEGIDRHSMSKTANVVEANTSAVDFEEDAPSDPVWNTSGDYEGISLNHGAAYMITGATTFSLSTQLLIHASIRVEREPMAVTADLPSVRLALQQSTDGGGTWAEITGTERRLRMRNTGDLCEVGGPLVIPGIDQTVSWSLYVGTVGDETLYRLGYQTGHVGQAFTFSQGIITLEALLE